MNTYCLHNQLRHVGQVVVVMVAMAAAAGWVGQMYAAEPARNPAAAPSTPSDFAGVVGSASHIDLTWTHTAENEESFAIQRKDVAGGIEAKWTDIATDLPGNSTRFQSVGLEAEHTYVHRTRAFNREGASQWVELGPLKTRQAPTTHRGRVFITPTKEFPSVGPGRFLQLESGQLIHASSRCSEVGDFGAGAFMVLARSDDEGRSWSEPQTLFQETGYDLYAESLVCMTNGQIGLSYVKRTRKLVDGKTLLKGEMVFRRSDDQCRTWSDEILISDGQWQYYQTSRGMILLTNGRLVHPVTRALVHSNPERQIVTLVYTSDDHGRTWQRRTAKPLSVKQPPGENYFHETHVVEHAPGKLLMFGRTRTGWHWESRSDDYGQTWSEPARSTVRGPVAPMALENIPGSQATLLIWNPFVSGEGWSLGQRKILASQISDDGGRTWRAYRQIEYGAGDQGSYCYPSCLWVDDTLHMTYFGNDTIRYAKLSKAWLIPEPSTLMLLGVGGLVLVLWRVRRRRAA